MVVIRLRYIYIIYEADDWKFLLDLNQINFKETLKALSILYKSGSKIKSTGKLARRKGLKTKNNSASSGIKI